MTGLSACSRLSHLTEEDCLTRAMYFESNRTSHDGMLAVGTVVMNRKASGRYPRSVCGIVGQKNQFAPGVLTKPMAQGKDLARKTAREVLRGARHTEVGRRAMFFHTAGYSYPYNNMHYVAIAGGNAFYEKRRNPTQTQEDVARRGDRLIYEPPVREAARQRVIATRIADAAPMPAATAGQPILLEPLPAPTPAQTLGTLSEVPLPAITIEQAIAGEGLY
nr:cell wall hydrolase [Aureimonas endophytica]